jgi:hypothetical protein
MAVEMPRQLRFLSIAFAVAVGGTGFAATGVAASSDGGKQEAQAEKTKTVCELIDESAAHFKLPIGFFTRLIWKESRFRSDAVSPKGAQGIAQFMPATAAIRSLDDPFDPASAIPASAHYLHDLVKQFGSLGLAAAAYNASEQRVADWLAGSGYLPAETRQYVRFITGRSAEDWASPEVSNGAGEAAQTTASGCAEVAALLSRPGAGSEPVAMLQDSGAAWAPWGVQVAGNFSAARASARFEALKRRHSAVLDGRQPLILRTVVKSRGTAPFYQVRLPADTRDEASRLCDALRQDGGACVVLKNAR